MLFSHFYPNLQQSNALNKEQMPLMGFGTYIGQPESDDIKDKNKMLAMTEEAVFYALKVGYCY